MKKIFLFASIALASGILFANIYTSFVDARSWGADIPRSIETAREYFKIVNAGNFFRMFAPINQVLALLVLILFWKASSTVRIFLGAALVFYILGDVFTFAYFYPRNKILFQTTPLPAIDELKNAWAGWNTMNWLRSLVFFTGIVFSFLALHKVYTAK